MQRLSNLSQSGKSLKLVWKANWRYTTYYIWKLFMRSRPTVGKPLGLWEVSIAGST